MSPTERFSWLRTCAWLVRRELWEHRALYVAPAAVAAFAVLAHFVSALVGGADREATLADAPGSHPFMALYDAATGAVVIAGLLVGTLYCLDALQGERRDRSILFWKSMPVSDLQTVLAKQAIPTLVMPVIVLALAVAANLLMVVLQSLAWTVTGYDPQALWARLDLPWIWAGLLYGLPFMSLWYAPLWGWLLLISAWARRAATLWALAPFAAFLIVEHGLLGHSVIHWALERWLGGGIIQPYTLDGDGRRWIEGAADLQPLRLLTLPPLWIGVGLAAAFVVLAVRVRRSRAPS